MNSSNKLIINAAITGTVLNKADTRYLPVSINEIVDCAQRVRQAGAAIVHLHARNPDQSPCFNKAVYCELVERVRQATDLIVCVSLSGRIVSDVEMRAAALASTPDMASLTLGSMNFMTQPSLNSPETIRELADRIYAAGAVPELEVFEVGFINYANYLIKKGIIQTPYYFNIILGSLGTAPLDLIGLGHMVTMLPPGATWGVGGLGRYQLNANVMSLAAGGHVRVGLEDNIYFDGHKEELADNPRLVERIARIAREMGREPATPKEARQIIGLPAL
ncbi:MAG: 3-keto-5-aminohexanoate cleavage protein [Deltaproteobacteria bacterium]|nr:3-keto-5-aminohexanoate cleavage protein [Deltaproteobacteria bacterium]